METCMQPKLRPKLPKKCKVQWDGFHRGFPHRVPLGNLRALKEVSERTRAAVPGSRYCKQHQTAHQ